MEWERIPLKLQLDQYDMILRMIEVGDKVTGVLEYNPDLFEEETIFRFCRLFLRTLAWTLESPDRSIFEFDLLLDDEKKQVLEDWNKSGDELGGKCPAPKLFEAQARFCENNPAIQFGDAIVSYGELQEKSNQLAHLLVAKGIGSGSLVGICLRRGPELIFSLLAIHKAGAAYVPLDPNYPEDRVRYMLHDSKATMVITESAFFERVDSQRVELICLEDLERNPNELSIDNLQRNIDERQLSHVIYTSGSTGMPKGVAIEHRSVTSLIQWASSVFSSDDLEGVLASTSICFDLSVFEIFFTLCSGGKVILVENALDLLTTREQLGIRLINTVPSVMTELLNGRVVPSTVRTINLAGEPLPEKLVQALYQLGHVEHVYNLYGPSEDTTYSTWALMARDNDFKVHIGRPLDHTKAYIVDSRMLPVPIGVPGELLLGGLGLSQGYLNKPGMTAARFVPNPFVSADEVAASRLYKTGDLVRYRDNGDIEYLGRIDHQIKIRGFRIELGEIEQTIANHPWVDACVVIARDDLGDDKKLVGYVVLKGSYELSSEELISFGKKTLAAYMMPYTFVFLDALPLTQNKKVDRNALPAPSIQFKDHPDENNGIKCKLSQHILEIWREVLKCGDIRLNDNFFELGGHSLLLAQVYGKLSDDLKDRLTMVNLIQYPTIYELVAYINGDSDEETFKSLVERKHLITETGSRQQSDGIAIVGVAGRFPGSETLADFWENIKDGVEGIEFLSREALERNGVDGDLIEQPHYIQAGAFLNDVKGFDAGFFGFTPREAQIMDPQQRIFLESAWEALENAGYDPATYGGAVGLYAGVGMNYYFPNHLLSNSELVETVGSYALMIGNDKDFLCTRAAYKLDLKGPAVVVQSACSTSLVAVHMASQGLLNGDCDMALAGGVSLGALEKTGYLYEEGMILSPDGHCRPFDEGAQGTVPGQGCAIVVLKRLEDAVADRDHIYGVLKGAGINNDGSQKAGYTAPRIEGQAEAIRTAQLMAGVDASSISYIEAHGTGTKLGDPIEIAGLTKAFREDTKENGFCAIGSLKSNLGHLDTAAGVASLIKLCMALDEKVLPPSLHYQNPNPEIGFQETPFYVNDSLRQWDVKEGELRRAGISAFGIGGTNIHLVVEEAPKQERRYSEAPIHLLTLSSRSRAGLEKVSLNLANYLRKGTEHNLSDIAYTLQVGRRGFRHRRMLMARNANDAIAQLEVVAPKRRELHEVEEGKCMAVLMFWGQDHEGAAVWRALYDSDKRYREAVDHYWNLAKLQVGGLRGEWFDDAVSLEKQLEGPAESIKFFIAEYALGQLLMKWGVSPTAMIGRGTGELVAACLADVFSFENALPLLVAREVEASFKDYWMTKACNVGLSSPNIPLIGRLNGHLVSPADALDPGYWLESWGFSDGVLEGIDNVLNNTEAGIVLDFCVVGDLSWQIRKHLEKSDGDQVLSVTDMLKEEASGLLQVLIGTLWLKGVDIDWHAYHSGMPGNRVPLPTYPFERQQYWVEGDHHEQGDQGEHGVRSHHWSLLSFSGESEEALSETTDNALTVLKEHSHVALPEIASSFHALSQDAGYRRFLVAQNASEAISILEGQHKTRLHSRIVQHCRRPVAFMFPGQGSQHLDMAAGLMEEPSFRKSVECCWDLVKKVAPELYGQLSKDDRLFRTELLHQTSLTQPALFIVEYALAKLLIHWGVRPKAFLGHSIGEYVAACLAGVFSLEDAIRIVCIRGMLMQACDKGEMLSVRASEAEVLELLTENVSIAVVNAPGHCVVAGSAEGIFTFKMRLEALGVENRPLVTSHAFHSPMMDPVIENFRVAFQGMRLSPPEIPFISNLTGTWIANEEATSPAYWAQHLRQTVRFSAGVNLLLEDPEQILVEVGPGTVLSTLAKKSPFKKVSHRIHTTMRHPQDDASDVLKVLTCLGHLWSEGVQVDWSLFRGQQDVVISSPVIHDRQHQSVVSRCDRSTRDIGQKDRLSGSMSITGASESPSATEMRIAQIWEAYIGLSEVGIYDDYFELGGDSLVAVRLLSKISKEFGISLPSHILIEKRTVRDLAEYVESLNAPNVLAALGDDSPIIEIHKGSPNNPPLYLVHPIGGEIYIYMDLPQFLGSEQTVYAIKAPSLMGKGEVFTNLIEQASYYVKELKRFQRKGRIILGGASYGGIVAYEMAQQLIAEDWDVPFVSIVDAPAPGAMPEALNSSAAILHYLVGDKMPLKQEDIEGLTVDEQLSYVAGLAKSLNKPEVLPPALGKAFFATWQAHQSGMLAYEPREIETRLIYFRHTEKMDYFPTHAYSPWVDLASKGIEIHQVPGNHISMNYNPHVETLGSHLRKALVSVR